MGRRGRPGTGVEPLKDSIRLRFTYAGHRRYETLDLEPTAGNIKAAIRLLADIHDKIRLGVFDYAKAFPNSKHVKGTVKSDLTVRELSQLWLSSHVVEETTRSTYLPGINFWNGRFGDWSVSDVTTVEIRRAVKEKSEAVSAKTVNNIMTPLRGMFELAVADELVERDPTQPIKNLKHQKPGPDPFTRHELENILGHMQQHHPIEVLHWFTFAFFTGMRPSEQAALRRADLDVEAKTVRVHTAHVMGVVKGTKTHAERYVDLTGRALRATIGRADYLFVHPETQEPWTRKQLAQRLHKHWYPTLDALGLHRRPAYQTRHTYATLNLMAGVNPAYIARQMGHKNMQMLLTTYSRWIDKADGGRERSKVEAALG